MLIQRIEIEKFRSFKDASFDLGQRITAIAGRNATQKTTVLGMIGQPFTISKGSPMYGCKTIDGYNFRSQFEEKFKISHTHDTIGDHRWKLIFHRDVFKNDCSL
jgi:AAA15 family ATPase/GTPase